MLEPKPPYKKVYDFKALKELGYTAKGCVGDGRGPFESFYYDSLVAAGFDAVSIKGAGFKDINELKTRGMSAKSLRGAFSLVELVRAKFTCKELKEAGFMLADMKDAYFKVYEKKVKLCHTVLLQEAKNAGIYKPRDFAEAGWTPHLLVRDGGFSAKELYEAGFHVRDVVGVHMEYLGIGRDDLRMAGYPEEDLRRCR